MSIAVLGATSALAQPPTPVPIAPGTGSSPGQSISDTTPTLQWQAATGATEYDVYVSREEGGSYVLIFDSEDDWGPAITGTSFTMPSGEISAGNEYRWNLRAKNAAGYSGFSTKLYFYLPSTSPPSTPVPTSPGTGSAPGQSISDTTPTLQWQAATGATEYDVYVSREEGGSYVLIFDSEDDWGPAITGTSFTVPSGEISAGNEYRWNLRAKNAAGYSSFSTKLYFYLPSTSPPSTPVPTSPGTGSAPGQSISDTTPTLQWQAATGATEYDVYVSRKEGGSYVLIFDSEDDWGPAITGTSFTLPSGEISAGNEYRWNLRAKNAAGYSGFSSTLYFYLPGVDPPSTPFSIGPGTGSPPGQSISDTTPTLQWQAATGASEYDVYVSRKEGASYVLIFDSEFDWGPAITGTTFTMPSGEISAGNEYRWNLRAKNAAGYSGFSSTLYFYLPSTSPPPTPVPLAPGTASAPGQSTSDATPMLEWQAATGATEYDVYVSQKQGGSYVLVFDSEVDWGPAITGTSLTLPSGEVSAGNEYRWNLRAKNAAGYSGFSNRLYFFLPGTAPPATPAPVSPGSPEPPGPSDGDGHVRSSGVRGRWLSTRQASGCG